MTDSDTIIALSSGALPSGVAIIRLSGLQTSAVLEALSIVPLEPRRLTLHTIRLDNQNVDSGLVAWMPAPHSFTGEDTAELQVHGSPAVVRAICARCATPPRANLRLWWGR